MSKKKFNALEFYQAEVVRWMELFGLGRWSVEFVAWDDLPEDSKSGTAATMYNCGSRYAKFALNPNMYDRPADTISRSALHEVEHIRHSRLIEYAEMSNAPMDEVQEESEALCKSMEHAFFGLVAA